MTTAGESEVRLTLLHPNPDSDGNSNNDGNNNLRLSLSSPTEAEDSFTDDTSTCHQSDDPSRGLLCEPPPKVIIIPAKNSPSKQSSRSTKGSSLELIWRNLSYSVRKRSWNPCQKATSRTLIHNLNGGIQSGQLTAIIGPSGAGKTTLIECLSGRRIQGVQGDIEVNYNGVSKSSIKVSYYSQHDSLNELLTVHESLMYASQLRNCLKSSRKKNGALFADINANNSTILAGAFPDGQIEVDRLNRKYYNQIVVERMLDELNLKKCAHVPVAQCSGGQKRRLSIALELIFSPSIFILDEPTSGLDSLSSLQCIAMLKKLVTDSTRPMIVATSIHQPTAKIMSYFDHLYIISNNGQCIYNGPTRELVSTLSRFGLTCPTYHNPADYVVEVASGDFGTDAIDTLADNFAQVCADQCAEDEANGTSSVKMLKLVKGTQSHSVFKQILTTVILTKRTLLITLRDPNIYITRLITILAVLALLAVLYKDEKIGILDGCVSRPTRRMMERVQSLELFDAQHSFYGNFGFLFFSVVLTVFLSILPTLLSFPLEVSVFIKENFNGWYSLKSYYIAHQIADLPPIFIFPLLFGSVSYFITYQFFEWHRFLLYQSVLIGLSFLAQGVGFLVSAYFVSDVTTSAIVGAILNVPLFLFTGLLIRISIMPSFFQPITYLSYFRLAFESLLVIIYGLDRCQSVEPINFSYLKGEFGDEIVDMFVCVNDFSPGGAENITAFIDKYNQQFLTDLNNCSSSLALKSFGYNNDTLAFNIGGIFLYIVVIRVIAYTQRNMCQMGLGIGKTQTQLIKNLNPFEKVSIQFKFFILLN